MTCYIVAVKCCSFGATSDRGEPQPGQQFVVVDITVENAFGEQREIAPLLHMSVEDGAGQSYALDATAGMGLLSIKGSMRRARA